MTHHYYLIIKICLLMGFWWFFALHESRAETFYFLSYQTGAQDTGQTNDRYLDKIEDTHGERLSNRIVIPLVASFDFYKPLGDWGSGFGIDLHRYTKVYDFEDKSEIRLSTLATLYSFMFYYRGKVWFPFFGFGTGYYTANISEKLRATETTEETKAVFNDAAPYAYHYKAGFRVPLGVWGFMISWYATSAVVQVRTEGEPLELGGSAGMLGVYLGF